MPVPPLDADAREATLAVRSRGGRMAAELSPEGADAAAAGAGAAAATPGESASRYGYGSL
jgi:hypothetical protein